MSTSFAKLDFEILKKKNAFFCRKLKPSTVCWIQNWATSGSRAAAIQLAECLIETIVYQNAWESALPKSWRRFANCRNV
jgi:hypothetical protein